MNKIEISLNGKTIGGREGGTILDRTRFYFINQIYIGVALRP